jgi:hypothetical protein
MAIYTGNELNTYICEMLNIDPTDVYRIELEAQVNEIARVKVFSYARTDEGLLHQFADIVKHYEIKEIK